MKYPTVFHLMAQEFAKVKIPFVLIGGFAVNHYRFSRATGDVDILMAEEDYAKARPILEKGGYEEVIFGKIFARFAHKKQTFLNLDVLFIDRNSMKGILKDANETKMEGMKIKVPSLKHLMALKLHALKNNPVNREIPDLIDLVNLIRENKIDVKKASFRELCLKYGSKDLYERIVQSVTK